MLPANTVENRACHPMPPCMNRIGSAAAGGCSVRVSCIKPAETPTAKAILHHACPNIIRQSKPAKLETK